MRLLAFVLAWILLPAAAFGFEFRDDRADLKLTLEPKAGEKLCVAWPEGNVDRAACEGFDTAAFAKIGAQGEGGTKPVAVGLMRRGDDMLLLIVQRDASGRLDVERDGDTFAKGMAMGMVERTGAEKHEESHRLVTLADRKMLEVEVKVDLEPTSPLAPLFVHSKHHAFAAGDVIYTVSVSSGKGTRGWVDDVSERAIDGLSADPPPKTAVGDDSSMGSGPKSEAFRRGEATGRVIGALMGVGLVVAFVVFVVRAATRKTPPPQTWYGPPPQGPGYPHQPGYPNHPGHPQGPGYPHQPGYPNHPGHPQQTGYPHQPGHPQQPWQGGPGYPPHPYGPPPAGPHDPNGPPRT